MLKKLLAGAAMVSVLAIAGSASALTYTTILEHNNNDGTVDGDFGLVTIEEEDANNILVTLTLNAPLTLVIDAGAHYAFTFNLLDDPNSTIAIVQPADEGSFEYLGEGAYQNAPFSSGGKTPVTWKNAFACCGQGSSNGEPPPFSFRVTNTSGITFAGIGATFDGDGRLLTTGTGNRFASTATGWWFASDVSDGTNTGVVAARDAFIKTAVPEPATWGLMILGFGAAGAMLRRRTLAIA
jgi:PEP-CTERM motif